MASVYCYHRVTTLPLKWRDVADNLQSDWSSRCAAAGGVLYGIWRSQIGRPRDELSVITVWADSESCERDFHTWLDTMSWVVGFETADMSPTLRPTTPEPPVRQGNYAFRWFETPPEHWDEFLDLCDSAWPGIEAAYDDVQVIGLWRIEEAGEDGGEGDIASLMLTRRPDLAMWERTKIPRGEAETEVRRKLSRRYDLCRFTVVHTATLLTANDQQDTHRWT